MTFPHRFLLWSRSALRSFARDDKGAVMLFVAIAIIPLIGFGLLAMDLARLFDLQTQLQKGADAFALAGAAELDGRPAVNGQGDSISRALAAINNLMASRNSTVWGMTPAAVQVSGLTFLTSLPQNNLPISTQNITTDPKAAKFVEVVVTPVTITTFLPTSILGLASNKLTTSASATAGFHEVVCQITPLFVCNPFEGSNSTSVYDPANVGKMFALKQGPSGSGAYSGGNYGYLKVRGNSIGALRTAIGAVSPNQCYAQSGVDTLPGDTTPVSDPLNVRFDLYSSRVENWQTNPEFPPALNVRKGCLPNASGSTCGENLSKPAYCNSYTDPNYAEGSCFQPATGSLSACGLPRDSSLDASGVGNGSWNLADYWTVNHDVQAQSFGAVVNTPWGPCTVGTPCNLVSRYGVYQYENSNNMLNDSSPGLTTGTGAATETIAGEAGAPKCSANANPKYPDRRVIYGAIVDCAAAGMTGTSSTNIPVDTFAKFFLVQPVSESQTIYVEYLGPVQPSDGVTHDLVQLFR